LIPPPSSGDATDQKAFVYLLQSKKNKKFYLGWTTDLLRRLGEHNDGLSLYTKSRGPWELVGFETFSNHEEAKKREKVLKNNPRMYHLFKKRTSLCSPVLLALKKVVG